MKHPSLPHSIFNDVIGPIMRGPSSSHTAGAYGIGRICRSLYGGLPDSVRCVFDPSGSYAPTYLPLGVDKAFCAGLLDWDMLDARYDSSVEVIAQSLEINFIVEPLQFHPHPNTMKIELAGKASVTIWAKSIGGGLIEIFQINEWPMALTGKQFDCFIEVERSEKNQATLHSVLTANSSLIKDYTIIQKAEKKYLYLIIVKSDNENDINHFINDLRSNEVIRHVWFAPPVFFPIVGEPIFHSAEEALLYAEKKNLSLGKVGVLYESKILGRTTEEVSKEMLRRYEVMCRSMESGFDDNSVKLSWLHPHAGRVYKSIVEGPLPFGGFPSKAAVRALAVMHTCNSRGIVCAAPTGGSAGVLPGVVKTMEEEYQLDREKIVEVLFAAGLIGLFIANRATFAAEEAGCQVEIGAAGAMAAASVVEAFGGPIKEAIDAASVALQNTMGSVCDPVGGGCEIPCHTRNAAAAANAFICADLICGGYPNRITLDDAIDASYNVGRSLPSELRCTAKGGIAVVPSAHRLLSRGEEQWNHGNL